MVAEIARRVLGYGSAARLTMWSLTLPQAAATLAATLVAFDSFNPLHLRLIDQRMLNVVLVLVLATATLGPVLTQYFAPRMLDASREATRASP
jgi:Na+:H+ antiporter